METEDNFFDMFISFNDNKTEAYLNIRPNSRINEKNLKEALMEAYKKVKLSLNFSELSYGIVSDKDIMENLKKYVSMKEEDRKKEIFSFLLAKGKLPVDGKDSEIIEYIDLNKKKSGSIDKKTGKIDHKDLGFSDRIVPENTKILSLKKPTKGEPGIAVTGEIIEPNPGKTIHKVKFDKKSIYTKENDEFINFYAAKEGFLYKDSSKGYFVDEKVLVKSIDYNVGNIDVDEVEESSVVVQGSTDVTESAIKPGFKVEAKNINVTGNIGAEAFVSGENIIVNGIADKESIIKGNNIKIKKVFNNTIEGKKIVIDEVNGSFVKGEKLFVKNCFSAEIKGSEILIFSEVRGSNFTTDTFIFIKKLTGTSKQAIILDPFFSEEKKKIFYNLKKEQKELTEKYQLLLENETKLKDKFKRLNSNLDNILNKYFNINEQQKAVFGETLKKLIISGHWDALEEKFKIEFALHDIEKMNNLAQVSKQITNIGEELKQIKDKKDKVTENIFKMKSAIKNAVIIIKSIQGSNLTIKTESHELNIGDEFLDESIMITFRNLVPEVKLFDKAILIKLKELLSEETFKALKKVVN